jgi:transcriptional regulator with XRE-family HTH domain
MRQPSTPNTTRLRDSAELERLVRERRRELGLTQQEVADLAGVHRATVAKFERGKGVRFPVALKVVHLLGMDLDIRVRGRHEP